MSKKCINCNNDIPDEASFCLKCFTVVDSIGTLAEKDAVNSLHKQKGNNSKNSSVSHIHAKKQKAAIIGAIMIFVFSIGISAISNEIANSNEIKSSIADEKQTTLVAVTQPDGTAVTDINGENVYEIVEVSTKKQDFWNKVFGGNNEKSYSDNDTQSNEFLSDNNAQVSVKSDSTASEGDSSANSTPSTDDSQNSNSFETSSVADFTYSVVKDKIKIEKYNGKASEVIVPATINGKDVSYIGANAFSNNANITKIKFQNQYSASHSRLFFEKATIFNNLPNLKSIVFPADTAACLVNSSCETVSDFYFDFYKIFGNLPLLASVSTTDNYGNNHINSEGGVIYGRAIVNNTLSNSVLYYPPAKKDKVFTIPSATTLVMSTAFSENDYLEKIIFHKNVKTIYGNDFGSCSALNCFEVESGNVSGYFSSNGVLLGNCGFTVNGQKFKKIVAYPPHKTDGYYELPDVGVPYLIAGGFNSNKHLTTLKMPSAKIYGDLFVDENSPPQLNKILLPSGDAFTEASASIVRSYSNGRCITELY